MTLKRSKRARPTLKDIARDVGVHVSTISRALNPKSGHAVSPDLVKKFKARAAGAATGRISLRVS